MLVTIRQKILYRTFAWGLAAIVINWLTFAYFTFDDVDKANLDVLQGKSIMIDPGHGGIDSGASGNGAIEKEITLAIAAKLEKIIAEHGGAATLTRNSDMDYYTRGKGGKRNDLLKRVALINNSGANLFVSIHCNAIRETGLFGAQVFYNNKLADNKLLAEIMQQALKNFPPGNKRQAKQDLNILVLNATTIPGILVETGYITNANEAAQLRDESYQQRLAVQIAKAMAYHFDHAVAR
ncbi:MAG: N-acetylmuramoyl-L-alanine amidase [Pelosinus sp.]|nr:N-acetylmuramoyl-L-alanine amidase [Pelosinus sp.]